MGADGFNQPRSNPTNRPLPPHPIATNPLQPNNPVIVDQEPFPFVFSKTPPTKQCAPGYRANSRDKLNIFPSHDSPIVFSSNRPVAVTCAPCVSSSRPQFHPPLTSIAQRVVPASILSSHSSRSHSLPRPNGNTNSHANAIQNPMPYSPGLSRNPDSDPHFDRSIEFRRSPCPLRACTNEQQFHRASIGASIDASRRFPQGRQVLADPQSNSPELSNRLVAIYDYNARTDEEISLRKGDSMRALNDRLANTCS